MNSGLQSDHTVHLVRGAPASVTSPGTPGATPTSAPTNLGGGLGQGNPLNPSSLGGLNFPNFGQQGGQGYGLGVQEIQQVQQQLMQNPTLMREMMNTPAVQNLMNNPDLMRSIIMSNPQMRDIIDRNPDLAHILNDPSTLRQTLEAARNPELMREMMRNTDRAMSNIEASPEGFNMLRRMYETVQEPLLNAATMGTDGAGDLAGNPFASLLGQNLGQAQGNTPNVNLGNNTNTRATGIPAAAPNTAPLPNPWNPARKSNGCS
jgi:ubiquilin